MPDIENSRKTAEKGAEWVTVKQPKTAGKTPETPEKHPKTVKTAVFRVFRVFFRLFYRDPLGTLFGCFSAVFNVGRLAPL